MKLYTVTIRGFKYYFAGDLLPGAINVIESFCLKLEREGKAVDAVVLFDRLIHYVTLELRLPITPVNVEHIFRINH